MSPFDPLQSRKRGTPSIFLFTHEQSFTSHRILLWSFFLGSKNECSIAKRLRVFDAWPNTVDDLKRRLGLILGRCQSILNVYRRHCCLDPEILVQLGVVKHTAVNCYNGPDWPFYRAIRLMRIRNSDLLLDSLIIIKCLYQSRHKLSCILCLTNLNLKSNCVCTAMMYFLMHSSLSNLARRLKPFMHPLPKSTISSKYLLPPRYLIFIGPQVSIRRSSNEL